MMPQTPVDLSTLPRAFSGYDPDKEVKMRGIFYAMGPRKFFQVLVI